VAGSGPRFEDRGHHLRKRVPGKLHLYTLCGPPEPGRSGTGKSMTPPETRYARSRDVHIAHQIGGRDRPDPDAAPCVALGD